MTTQQAVQCQGRTCFGQPTKGEPRKHDNNNEDVFLCDTCAPELEHAGVANCWCTQWHVRWWDTYIAMGGFEMYMEASHHTDYAETKIWFSIRAWTMFCEASNGTISEGDSFKMKRVMSSWGLEQVKRYIENYVTGKTTGKFTLPPDFRLTTDQSSAFRLDPAKAEAYLRRWKLL